MANYNLQIGVLSPKFCNSFSLEIASVAGARNKWAQERTGGVSPSRAPVLSCAHLFLAPAMQASLEIQNVTSITSFSVK